MRKPILLVALVALLSAGCGMAHSQQTLGDLRVAIATAPSPAKVGENVIKVTLRDEAGQPVTASHVSLHYYPFVQRTKDILASPDEVVRVADAAPAEGAYSGTAKFDKPGTWKVTVKIARPGKPDTLPTFTFDVRA